MRVTFFLGVSFYMRQDTLRRLVLSTESLILKQHHIGVFPPRGRSSFTPTQSDK